MKERLTNFQMSFQTKSGKFFISENPTGQETIFMLPHYSDKGSHLARSQFHKACKKTGLPKGIISLTKNPLV